MMTPKTDHSKRADQDKKDTPADLTFLADVPLTVSVTLGETFITIEELLLSDIGTVIELRKLAGEPLEILVNDRVVARGEVVVVNDNYGIRFTDGHSSNNNPMLP